MASNKGEVMDDVLGFDPPPDPSLDIEIPETPPKVEAVDVAGQSLLRRKQLRDRGGRRSTILNLTKTRPTGKNKQLG